jgi:hypothetical protein
MKDFAKRRGENGFRNETGQVGAMLATGRARAICNDQERCLSFREARTVPGAHSRQRPIGRTCQLDFVRRNVEYVRQGDPKTGMSRRIARAIASKPEFLHAILFLLVRKRKKAEAVR